MSLIPVENAQDRLLSGALRLPTEIVPISEADGRVLAEDLVARRTQPPMAVSAMDGYAIRCADAASPGARLKLVGESAAGHGYDGTVQRGETVRIFTGAPVPAGTDSVMIQELVTRDGDIAILSEAALPGRNIRPAGLDFTTGAVGLAAGIRLGMRDIALAAAMDHGTIPVTRRPRVALLATGDELVAPGQGAGTDRIVASNTLALAALVRAEGGIAIDLGIAPDRLEVLRDRIRAAREAGADIICLVGGASVGDHDLTRPAFEAEGLTLDFWKIAMRPGKPLMYGKLGELFALGLPGNPVSSLVCGLLFLAPLIRKLSGQRDYMPPEETAILAAPLKANDMRQDYLRATLIRDAGRLQATALDLQDSSAIRPVALANCLIIRTPHAPALAAGAEVPIIRL